MEAAKAGYAPQLPDGSMVTIHHINQSSKGPIVEASTKNHGFGKPGHKALHNVFGRNEKTGQLNKNPDNPVNHNLWKQEQKEYWKERGSNVLKD